MKKKIFAPYILPFKMHTPNMIDDIIMNAPEDSKSWGPIKIPLNIFKQYLVILAERCTEINDPILNKIMCDMTMYSQADPSTEDYSEEMLRTVDKNYNDYLKSIK